MRILLIGEYSKLHNSLKKGLEAHGHEVFLVGMGDSFKKFHTDYNYDAVTCLKPWFKIPNKIFKLIFKKDLSYLERAYRFAKILPQLKNYDVIQLINEAPIQTFVEIEKWLLDKLIKQNKKTFLLSCGADYPSVQFAFEQKLRYSIFDIIKQDPKNAQFLTHPLKYLQPKYRDLSQFLYKNTQGVIASDWDYVLPLENHPHFLGLIPNPIILDEKPIVPITIVEKIIIFLGINTNARIKKGIPYFEKALEIIKQKYSDKVAIIVTKDLPYSEYIKAYNQAHILLDQIYAYDQGYNALEAMAQGKVVFTGAESEFNKHYNLHQDQVAINSLPNVDYLVEKLSLLIENPQKISQISLEAQKFIRTHHYYIDVAKQYITTWEGN
ncbi:MAG: glycosyltransferase [Bacteroidota bacterium]|nr:glycosyltransferase [Bacteroidota bacterium]